MEEVDDLSTMVILAAGAGSRYQGLKQFDEIGPKGEFLWEYSVKDAYKEGLRHLVLIIRSQNLSLLKQKMVGRFPEDLKVDYAIQKSFKRKKMWGTVHALCCAKEFLRNPFVLLNADDYYGAKAFTELTKGIQQGFGGNLVGAVLAYPLSRTLSTHGAVTRAICAVDDQNYLKKLVERRKIYSDNVNIYAQEKGTQQILLNDFDLASMNYWYFRTEVLDYMEQQLQEFWDQYGDDAEKELAIPEAVNSLLSKGVRFGVIPSNEEWFGLTYLQDRKEVMERMIRFEKRGLSTF